MNRNLQLRGGEKKTKGFWFGTWTTKGNKKMQVKIRAQNQESGPTFQVQRVNENLRAVWGANKKRGYFEIIQKVGKKKIGTRGLRE